MKKHVEAERRLNEEKPKRERERESGTKEQKQRFVYSEWTR